MSGLKTFELVLIGHPDKVCDLVSKTIADANPGERNAIECMWGNRLFVISGETTKQWTNDELENTVLNTLSNIGLTNEELESLHIVNNLNIQSEEINTIVGDSGTGDNGIYYGGYHKVYTPVIRKMKELCVTLNATLLGSYGYRTDGKFIFTVDRKGRVIDFVLNVAKFKDRNADSDGLSRFIKGFLNGNRINVTINPKGDWVKCFGFADCGLTGRKLACDNSCGLFPHGGGAFFGKDISKSDVTVPLFLERLAEENIGKFKNSCLFSASSIIGDTHLDVFKDGGFFERISYKTMKKYVENGGLDVFGSFKELVSIK